MIGWKTTLWLHARTAPVFPAQVLVAALIMTDAPWWTVGLAMVVVVHFMHACLLAFHEASHYHFAKPRWYNDAVGMGIGALGFMSLTLYRRVHRVHHARLGAVDDDELWPFNRPGMPRFVRVLAAVFELCLGIVFTPLLFMRAFLRPGSPVKGIDRIRVLFELHLILVVWTVMLSITMLLGTWDVLLFSMIIPAVVAGNVQSWRKYVEHVGLTSATQAGGTRSIVSTDKVGKVLSSLMLHEPFHGVHHRHASLSCKLLPSRANVLPVADGEQPLLFRSYAAATVDMLKCLGDPKVGGQWSCRT